MPLGTYGFGTVPNVQYNPGAASPQYCDIYYPTQLAGGAAVPAQVASILVIHGGHWQDPSNTRSNPNIVNIAQTMAQAGYVALAPDYTLYKTTTPAVSCFPQNLMDAKTAVQYLRANATNVAGSGVAINPAATGVTGTSAGAHLAALLCVTDAAHGGFEPTEVAAFAGISTAVQAGFLFYCPFSNLSTPATPVQTQFATGGTLGFQATATPISYVRPGLPPMVEAHGTIDNVVPYPSTAVQQQALVAVGNSPGAGVYVWANEAPVIDLQTMPGLISMTNVGHEFCIVNDGTGSTATCDAPVVGMVWDLRPTFVRFFDTHLAA